MTDECSVVVERGEVTPSLLARSAFWLFIATLAWAPFPLGSNRVWSATILTCLVVICWCLWGLGTWKTLDRTWAAIRQLRGPLILGSFVLIWACFQICSWAPADWNNPIWAQASVMLHRNLIGAISINPWRTQYEIIKLATFVGVLLLAFIFSLRDEWAGKILNSVIAITATYAAYALFLRASGIAQYEMFYVTPLVSTGFLSGPFVLHNSYATFAGLGSLAAGVKLVAGFDNVGNIGRDIGTWIAGIFSYAFGTGVRYLVAFVLTFSTLIASASRAGFLATAVAMVSTAFFSAFIRGFRLKTRWGLGATALALVAALGLILVNGDTLVFRLNELVDAGGVDDVRSTLWAAALRMIAAHPLLGLGLGTFQDGYPLFADRVLPYTIDKAHNDYLELAAGVGVPAAFACWVALTSLAIRCFNGALSRRRNRLYALLGLGSFVLVAVHSGFDFSLQIPAVAMLFTTLLGLGLGQSLRASQRDIYVGLRGAIVSPDNFSITRIG